MPGEGRSYARWCDIAFGNLVERPGFGPSRPNLLVSIGVLPLTWLVEPMRTTNDLLHGTLDILVLKTLSWAPMHGYAIAQWIEQRARGDLEIVDAALYKALHRLEQQ